MAKRSLFDDNSRVKAPRLLPYHIKEIQHRVARRYGYEERNFRATFDQQYMGHRLIDIQQQLEDMFQDVVDKATERHGPHDKARVVIQHNDLRQDIVTPMRPESLITGKTIMDRMEKVLQSDESLSVDNSFHVNFGIFHPDKGGGSPIITIPEIPNDTTGVARSIISAWPN